MIIRAATHVHSDWSYDGCWPLSSLASVFSKLGYNCVLTTEHDSTFNKTRWQSYRRACNEYSSDDFLIIPGMEYSDPLNVVHVLVWGDVPFLESKEKTSIIIKSVQALEGIAILAHPSRRNAIHQYDSKWTPFLNGIEVWNRKADGISPCREALDLARKIGLPDFVGLDFHHANQFFPLYMSTKINGKLTEKKVLDQIKNERIVAKVGGLSINFFSKGIMHEMIYNIENFRRYIRKIVKGNRH